MKARTGALLTAALFLGPLALAQQPSPTPPQAGARPSENCPCGHMMEGGGGMMGHEGHGGMSCPMRNLANVTVEQTPTGAVMRFTAKDPKQVAEVQQMARKMESCMGAGQQSPGSPSTNDRK